LDQKRKPERVEADLFKRKKERGEAMRD